MSRSTSILQSGAVLFGGGNFSLYPQGAHADFGALERGGEPEVIGGGFFAELCDAWIGDAGQLKGGQEPGE